jgi:Family of unknown function (DUF6186)
MIFLAGYALIILAFLGCQLVASRRPDRVAPAGEVVRSIKRRRVGWVALVVAFWWLGFHVLARSSALGE